MTLSEISAAASSTGVAAVVLFTGTLNLQASDHATRVIDYRPAPGQFVNLEITTNPSGALGPVGNTGTDPATEGIVSLGGFGGYIILGFDRPIVNDPQHPYGVDFTIIGNAISTADGSSASCEPGAVQVMKDTNGNGIPDDGPWLELAGSDYWLRSTRRELSLTYTNPAYTNSHAVPWTASDGSTGAVLTTAAHTQPYYPDSFLFPEIAGNSYTLSGNCIPGLLNKRNPSGIHPHRTPAFGYADVHGTPADFDGAKPHNPYFADSNGDVTDGFDISWAVDANGNPVELDQIDFIRIYTAVAENAGWLGELSTEVDGIVLTQPDPTYEPQDYYLHYLSSPHAEIALGTTMQLDGLLFKNGRPANEGTSRFHVADGEIGSVSADGLFTPLKEGRTTVSFSQLDGVPAGEVEITVVSLTGVVFDLGDKASATASTDCIVSESLFLPVESTSNHTILFPDEKGNRYTADSYTWYNSNPATGTIDANGTFCAKTEGTTVVTAVSRTDPSLYAEAQITVKGIPAVALNRTTMEITESAPAGNWSAASLFKTTNRSAVTITSATSRNGLFPCELRGNRIVYDCSTCPESFTESLDIEVLHYGQQHTFTLTVAYTRDGSDIGHIEASPATSPDNGAPIYYNLQGMRVSHPSSNGLYIVVRGTSITKEYIHC